jgi:hypothetical protein
MIGKKFVVSEDDENSVQIRIRLTSELKKYIAHAAVDAGVSQQRLISEVLEQWRSASAQKKGR